MFSQSKELICLRHSDGLYRNHWRQLLTRSPGLIFGLIITTVLLTGCDPDYVGTNELREVEGAVYLDQSPVTDAIVIFVPIKLYAPCGKPLGLRYGRTDGLGHFSLQSEKEKLGVEPGFYKVFVSKIDVANCGKAKKKQIVSEAAKAEEIIDIRRRAILALDDCRLQQPCDEIIPTIYNCHSILVCEIPKSIGKFRPRFNLTKLDPMLVQSDLPLIEIGTEEPKPEKQTAATK